MGGKGYARAQRLSIVSGIVTEGNEGIYAKSYMVRSSLGETHLVERVIVILFYRTGHESNMSPRSST